MTDNDAFLPVDARSTENPLHIGFLLIPDFALLPYASTIEPLRAANRLSGRPLYRWSHVSLDGAPASASNGVSITADYAVGAPADFDYLFVCAGGNPAIFHHPASFAWLRRLARRGVPLGGISGGPYVLARAGLLAGYRVTLHWEHAPAFREDYPDIDLRRSLFEIDRDRLTAGGGTAPLDMMHVFISARHGAPLARAVSEWFLQTHVREGTEPQRMPLRERIGVANPILLKAVEHMERHIEQPLAREAMARLVQVSLRQLERLFRTHLNRSMGDYYLGLRLERAAMLIRQSSLSVLEVSLACGFVSASHFSRAYRARFGASPRYDRLPPSRRG